MNCRTFYGVEIAVMRRFPRPFALGLAVVLATGLLNGVVVRAEAETEFQPRALRRTPSVPVVAVTGAKQDLPPARGVGPQPKPAWPAAATATVALPPRATNRSASAPTQAIRAGALPVSVARPVGGSTTAVAGEPASVRVEVFDHERAQGQGHHVMVFGVGRADGVAEPGQVRVEVDYTGFRSAYGADWSNRLRLVSLPVCALTAPDRPDCRAVPVASANDAAGGRVSAQVTAATGGSLYALDATPSGNTGDFTATSLSSAGSWSVGGSSGEFSWSYPLAVPPGLGGPTPKLALAYSSQSVDGHTAASNNQPSWIGEGFDLWPGYIERRYKACADDMGAGANNTVKTGDEYWKVTTVDGTQYFFGLNHRPVGPPARRRPTPHGPHLCSATTPGNSATATRSTPRGASRPTGGTSTMSSTRTATRCRTGTRRKRTPTRATRPIARQPRIPVAVTCPGSSTAREPTRSSARRRCGSCSTPRTVARPTVPTTAATGRIRRGTRAATAAPAPAGTVRRSGRPSDWRRSPPRCGAAPRTAT